MEWQLVTSIAAPALGLIGVYVGAHYTRRTGRETTQTEFLAEMREWTEDRLAERDQRIDKLEDRLDAIERKYRAAIAYIRRLIVQLRRHETPEPPPEEIVPDL